MSSDVVNQVVWWVGAVVLGSATILLTLFIWYWIVEYAIRLFKVKRLLLSYYAEQLRRSQPRITTPKPRAP